jgi:hypothetical protein
MSNEWQVGYLPLYLPSNSRKPGPKSRFVKNLEHYLPIAFILFIFCFFFFRYAMYVLLKQETCNKLLFFK